MNGISGVAGVATRHTGEATRNGTPEAPLRHVAAQAANHQGETKEAECETHPDIRICSAICRSSAPSWQKKNRQQPNQ